MATDDRERFELLYQDILEDGFPAPELLAQYATAPNELSEEERLEVLSELQSIDYLVVFEEATADHLIESVVPSVYVKGGDYQASEIAEFDLLTRLGIQIGILAHRPGLGSTAIIDRLRSS